MKNIKNLKSLIFIFITLLAFIFGCGDNIDEGPNSPDTTNPQVSITKPTNNATVSGIVEIIASATDDRGIDKVEFIIDNVVKGTDNTSPYSYSWNTAGLTGSHTIRARAYDTAGNNTISNAITVVISNETGGILKVYAINVGQGDATLIISPTKTTMLIDAGDTGKGSAVINVLNSEGITSLNYTVATHYHADHIGGLDEVINSLGGSTKIINYGYDRGGTYTSVAFSDYQNAIGSKRKTIAPGDVIDMGGGATVKCLAVNENVLSKGTACAVGEENAKSIVLLLKYGNFEMYLGGDVTSEIEACIISVVGDVDVYKVSHHGSNTSSSQIFINTIKPEVSFIYVGNGNSYGHPHSETITKLVNANSYIYQTETGARTAPAGKGEVANGTFLLTTDGCTYTISGSSLKTTTRNTDTLCNR